MIAIGTTRLPKLRALESALSDLRGRCPDFLGEGFRIEARSVPSGAPEMPRSTVETMSGARGRAHAAREMLLSEGQRPALAVGLEGGVFAIEGGCFLESWAYVTDGDRSAFGSSGSIPLPGELEEAVLLRGETLGEAADRFFGRTEVASHEGTFGLLTRMMVSRQEAFQRSLLHALAPFYNVVAYRRGGDRGHGEDESGRAESIRPERTGEERGEH